MEAGDRVQGHSGQDARDKITVMRYAAFVAALLICTATLLGVAPAADPAAVQQAFDRFLSAPDRDTAARLATDLVGSGVTCEDAYARLKRGRNYSTTAPHGLRRLSNRTSDGLEHEYVVIVPDNYDAAR